MKHIRSFEKFKENRKNEKTFEKSTDHYYRLGKSSNKSIFEMELLSEGYSNDLITVINENISLQRVDEKIVDCIFEYLNKGTENNLDLLTEELTIMGRKLPSFSDMYQGVANVVDKGIEIGKSVIKSFKDFISNIGNIIKNLFGKIKNFFMKIWEFTKPKLTSAMTIIKKSVSGGITSKMKGAVDTITSDNGQEEIDNLSEDLKNACAKFSSGNMGNMSDDAAQKLEDEAGEYKDIEGDEDVEKLMQESIEYRSTVRRIYYSIKGYMLEGGKINEIHDAIFEAEQTKVELAEGDEVTYKNKDGIDVTKKILRIEGEEAVFTAKDGSEFKKQLSDLKKTEGIGKKLVTGFVGEEPEKKGVFGWLVEAVGFVFNPLAKLYETLIKGGSNGICILISAIARGMKNAVKYVLIGVVAGLVYHIIHGLVALTGGGHGEEGEEKGKEGKPEGKPEGGAEAAGKAVEGGAEAAGKAAQGGAEAAGKAAEEASKAVKSATQGINLNKESFLFEAEAAAPAAPTEGLPVDMNKPSKYTPSWDSVKGMLLPICGSLLLAALSHFFKPVHMILEGILVAIGIFELVGAVCKIESIKSKNLKVCKLQHDAHHFIEAKASGN